MSNHQFYALFQKVAWEKLQYELAAQIVASEHVAKNIYIFGQIVAILIVLTGMWIFNLIWVISKIIDPNFVFENLDAV